MVSKEQRKEMTDYLVSRLEPVNEKVIPRSKEIVSGINSSYIIVDGLFRGVVLLVDQIYSNGSFWELHKKAKAQFGNPVGVVMKDGETFFRNAMERNFFKQSRGLSLKGYSVQEMQRMILFRPEEIFLLSVCDNLLQYYQLGSEYLGQGLESFRFEPVCFDYSHIDSHERFKPSNTYSKRLGVWKKRNHSEGNLRIVNGLLENVNGL